MPKSKPGCREATVLRFCNPTNATLKADLAFTAMPWEALRFHYHMLGIRAGLARRTSQVPNGDSYRERLNPAALRMAKKAVCSAKQPDPWP